MRSHVIGMSFELPDVSSRLHVRSNQRLGQPLLRVRFNFLIHMNIIQHIQSQHYETTYYMSVIMMIHECKLKLLKTKKQQAKTTK